VVTHVYPAVGVYRAVVTASNSVSLVTATTTVTVTTPSPDLSIDRSGSDVVLSWNAVRDALSYRVHRSTQPFFTPTAHTAIGDVATVGYTDTGAIGDPATNYVYLVTAVGAQGAESAPSGRVGEFDMILVPGRTILSLPLLPGSTVLDDVIGDQLTGTCDPATADRMLFWDAEARQYEMAWYCDCDPWGEPWDDHWLTGVVQTSLTLEPGGAAWVQNRQALTETLSVVGDLPSTGWVTQVVPGWQMIGLPYPISVALDDTAIPAVGSCTPTAADRVLRWNTGTQRHEMAWYCDCDLWGQPWDDHWLTGLAQTSIQFDPGEGIWFHNRHDPFTWVYPHPSPD
jgi:hypothetical protein